MRVFVSEYLSSGAWPERLLGNSLADEGTAMLLAVCDDFSRISGCEVVTTWDNRLGKFPLDNVVAHAVSNPDHERQFFRQLTADCDATMVIAPEFNGILAERCRIANRRFVDPSEHGPATKDVNKYLGCGVNAIELFSDKLKTARFLQHNQIPTIETSRFDPRADEPLFSFPVVVKPRHGAGSLQTFLIEDRKQFDQLRAIAAETDSLPAIQQPYVSGQAVSIAVLVSDNPRRFDVFPVAEQRFGSNREFNYLGGRIPARIDAETKCAIEQVVLIACECSSELFGYVGFDLIIPHSKPRSPLVVDVNPRLTTSYLGYRALTNRNLAERILLNDKQREDIDWKLMVCQF